jgi:iron complex outermembrane receptor protein
VEAHVGLRRFLARLGTLVVSIAIASAVASAQERSVLSGTVTRPDGTPLPGVMVLVQETGAIEWTSTDGRYTFRTLAPGAYTLLLSLGGYSVESKALMTGGQTTLVESVVDWPLSFVEMLVVRAPSRQVESIADAPAAVTTLDATDIGRRSASTQVPLLLASLPGVQVVQSGLYDFSVNARGFNDFTNRRVRTEIDGRDASMPQVQGYTDWATLAFGLGEIQQMEFVRGPGGALYGLGAINGVLSIETKAPADSLGGRARVTFGELATSRADARMAVALGSGWYMKVLGGYQRSRDFARSRVSSVEYAPGRLPTEAVPLVNDHAQLTFGSVRVDRQTSDGRRLVVEAGTMKKDGQVQITSLGRYQATDQQFPWARAAWQSPRWNLTAAYTVADISDQVALSVGEGTYQFAYNFQLDGHTNRSFAAGRGRWVGGASYARQKVDSANPQGVQTNYEQPETADNGSVFGQVDYRFSDRLKAAVAARVDASTLSRTTLSPRGAVMYDLGGEQRLRVGFSIAYKAPTIAERRLRAPLAPALDLSALEQALAPVLGGTALGFSTVPLLAVGNEALDVEKITSVEAGYSALVGGRTFAQAVYYRNRVNTFTSGLLPQVGTSLGRLNPAFQAYRPPSTLSPAAAAIVTGAVEQALPASLYASMSNLADGSPIFAVLSVANFGKADTQGLEISTITQLDAWRIDASYTWFDFSITNDAPDVPLLPNTPAHQGALGLAYVRARFDAGARLRLVDGFDWVSGIYAGPVPGYGVVDLQGNYQLTPRLQVGIDVTNAFNHLHYQVFGGDLLRRRALAHATVVW